MEKDFTIDLEWEIEEAKELTIRDEHCRKLGMDRMAEMFEEVARLCNAKVRVYRQLLEIREKLRPRVQ